MISLVHYGGLSTAWAKHRRKRNNNLRKLEHDLLQLEHHPPSPPPAPVLDEVAMLEQTLGLKPTPVGGLLDDLNEKESGRENT